jgi:hypothetical protein
MTTGGWPRSRGFRDLGKRDTSMRELCHVCKFRLVRIPRVQTDRLRLLVGISAEALQRLYRRRQRTLRRLANYKDKRVPHTVEVIDNSPGLENRETWATFQTRTHKVGYGL